MRSDYGPGELVWHEIGHAVDAVYGTGGRQLSAEQEWCDLHRQVVLLIGGRKEWDHYFDNPSEDFSAWIHGGTEKLYKFALGDRNLAQQLKDYFDRVLR